MPINSVAHLVKIVTCVACFCVASSAAAERLIGLGVHQETGRDIYLGALYLNDDTKRPANLRDLAAPRVMEYRVVARRTSIRSLLGGMLLQSEIATGSQPSPSTTAFADAVLSKIRSSLYAGDSLRIALTADNKTAASLNGYIVTDVDDPEVANYLLAGWLNDNGASTQFRSAINATVIDAELRARLENTFSSDERSAAIAASLGAAQTPAKRAPEQIEDTLEISEAEPTKTLEPAPVEPETQAAQSNGSVADVFQPGNTGGEFAALSPEEVEELPLAQTYPTAESSVDSTPNNASAHSNVETEPQSSNEVAGNEEQESPLALNLEPTLNSTAAALGTGLDAPQSAASNVTDSLAGLGGVSMPNTAVALTGEDLGSIELDSEVLSLGVREYSQRLSTFHNGLVAKVYRQIKYPKRAVRRNLEGRIELDITLRKSGELVTVAIAQSSGHKLLDEAAVKAAEAAMSSGNVASLDVVAVAEFGNRDGRVVVPVPVNFQLTKN